MVTEATEEALAPETETSPIVSTPPPKGIAELPAPAGWKKKFAFLNKDGTPKRRDVIIFVSPDGEEIKNKKDLDRYLKKHPGGPEFSEFDWSTGETPRRSARLSSKTKAIESPKSESGNKRARKRVSKEAVSTVTEEVKEEPAKPVSPTVEEKEIAMEDVEKEAGETVKAEKEHISASVSDEEPSKKTEEVVHKKPEEEPEKLESEKDAVAVNGEEVSGGNKHDGKVPLEEESQQNKEGVAQQSGLDTENLNSVHAKTGTSQMADLQNPSEPVGA